MTEYRNNLNHYFLNNIYAVELTSLPIPSIRYDQLLNDETLPTVEEAQIIVRTINKINLEYGFDRKYIGDIFPAVDISGTTKMPTKTGNVVDEYINVNIRVPIELKEKVESRLKAYNMNMTSWSVSNMINFVSPGLFHRMFGKDQVNQTINMLIDSVVKLTNILKKLLPNKIRGKSNNDPQPDERLIIIEKKILEMREELKILTKDEKIRLAVERELKKKLRPNIRKTRRK